MEAELNGTGPGSGERFVCVSDKLHRFRVELPKLKSTFALDQLTGLSHLKQRIEFIAWLMSLFAADIPLSAYLALRRDLREHKFRNPPLHMVPNIEGGHAAAYDESTQRILVTRELVERARKSEEDAWELMIALVEEFGHHVHYCLRHRYSKVGGDAPGDEGAMFAHAVVLLRFETAKKTAFATWSYRSAHDTLHVDHTKMHDAVQRWLGEEDLRDDERQGSLKFFGAGTGHGKPDESFGHESIEFVLEQAGIRDYQRHEVYFGNWLRDFSQFVDPKAMRPPGSTDIVLTRSDLTEIVSVLAEAKFGTNPLFKVTSDRLGVYRPEEHIDNPKGIEDATWLDPDFSKAYRKEQGDIDPKTLLKVYIQDSVRYMEKELLAAVTNGPTAEGRRHLGQALHTLEDYFAHSNFVELSLIKSGFGDVFPWTARAPAAGNTLPLVTGSFGSMDTVASVMLLLAEMLQKDEPFALGQRTSGQKILLIILRRQYPKQAKRYEWYLNFSEDFQRNFPRIYWLIYHTVGRLSAGISWLLGGICGVLGNNIDEAQSLFDNDPMSTDPTHTQLAKDHDDHPLHTLAAILAQEATLQVAKSMTLRWEQRATPQDAAQIARSYICHPNQTTWMDQRIKDWAQGHQKEVRRAASKTWLEDLQKHRWQQIRKQAESLYSPVSNAMDQLIELLSD